MADYTEEIKTKEIGIISLKVKTKNAEVIIFEEEVANESEIINDSEVGDSVDDFYNNEIEMLKKEYGDNIPEDLIKKARNLADAMGVYWGSQSFFSENVLNDLANKIAVINSRGNENDYGDVVLKKESGSFYHFRMFFKKLFI